MEDCIICGSPINENSSYYIHQPGEGSGLCQTPVHSACQLSYICSNDNDQINCMFCRSSLGTSRHAIGLIQEQERLLEQASHQHDIIPIIQQEVVSQLGNNLYITGKALCMLGFFQFIGMTSESIGILGNPLFQGAIIWRSVQIEYYRPREGGTKRKSKKRKSRKMKGGKPQTGTIKTLEDLKHFVNVIFELNKENKKRKIPQPFDIIIEGNINDIRKLLETIHMDTSKIVILKRSHVPTIQEINKKL